MKLNSIIIYTCVIILTLCASVQGAVAQQNTYIVTANKLNIRAETNKNAIIIGTLHRNDTVLVNRSHNGWHHIRCKEKYGWVHGAYLKQYKQKRMVSREIPWYDMSNPTVVFWWIMCGMSLVMLAGIFISGLFSSFTAARVLRIILIFCTSAVITYYFTQMNRPTWFYDTPYWWRDVVNFMLFFMFVMFLCGFAINEMKLVSKDGGKTVNPSKAILGIAITAAVFAILNYVLDVSYKMAFYIVGGILVYITFKVLKNVRFLYALLYLLLFSVFLATLGVIGYYCAKPFIILGLIMISGGGAVSGSESEIERASGGTTTSYSGGNGNHETYEENKSINVGASKVELEEDWTGDLSGSDGNDYEYTSPFKDKVRRKE